MKKHRSFLGRAVLYVGLMGLLASFVLSACAQPAQPAATAVPVTGEAPAEVTQAGPGEPQTGQTVQIRMAVLPVLDALPLYVAQQEGLFEKYGVQVELIPAGSAPKRDELINAGQADGMINETLSTMFYNKEEPRVQVVRFARTATADSPVFRILSAPRSNITIPSDLKNVEIGISQGTVIEYLTDRMLQAEGLSPEEINGVAVPDIGQRMALLQSGELKAATLPDPLASLAIQQGATVIVEDSIVPNLSHSVYTFRKEFIDQNPQAMSGFLAAIEEAVRLINTGPDQWGSLLAEQQLVPPPILETFQLPQFATAGVPSEEQWNDVLAWAKEKGLLEEDVAYSGSVTSQFLPR